MVGRVAAPELGDAAAMVPAGAIGQSEQGNQRGFTLVVGGVGGTQFSVEQLGPVAVRHRHPDILRRCKTPSSAAKGLCWARVNERARQTADLHWLRSAGRLVCCRALDWEADAARRRLATACARPIFENPWPDASQLHSLD